MQTQHSFLASLLAGALGGAVITTLLFQNPQWIPRRSTSPEAEVPIPFTASSTHEDAIVNVVKAAQPAVVSVMITQDVPVVERYFEDVPNSFFGPFGGFFGNGQFNLQVPQLRQNGTEKREVGGGSGFLVSADGYIVTNRHVVGQEKAEYTVLTNDGKKYTASVIARDPVNDVAVLKIDGNSFPFLTFSDTPTTQVGQSVIAIGNALGEFRNTVSVGVVSGLARSIVAGDGISEPEQLNEVIQTDAAINPGNSGGPLLNLHGQVVGVNVAVALGSQNVGFALPASDIASAVEQVKREGKITRAFLGVRYVLVTPAVKESNKLSVDYGVLVSKGQDTAEAAVISGSPADKAGIVEGDIILEVDGTKLDENTSLASVIAKKKVGDSVQLTILHAGQEKTVSVTLAATP